MDNSQYIYQAAYASLYGQRPISLFNTPQKYAGCIVDTLMYTRYNQQLSWEII